MSSGLKRSDRKTTVPHELDDSNNLFVTSPSGQPVRNDPTGTTAQPVKTLAGDEVAVQLTTADPLDGAGAAAPIKYARINATALGDNAVVAAVGGKKIRVLGYAFTTSVAVAANFQDTQVTPVVHAGPFDLAANGGVSFAGGLAGPAFETAAGQGVEMNLSVAANVRGHLTYVEV